MYRFLLFLAAYLLLTSCSHQPKNIDTNLEITIRLDQSYKYDLKNKTLSVHNTSRPDTIVHFNLSADANAQIIQKYYELDLDTIKGIKTIEDECMNMPKFLTTLEVKSKKGLQQFTIDEDCEDFTSTSADLGSRIKKFLEFVTKKLKEVRELKNTPASDIIYI